MSQDDRIQNWERQIHRMVRDEDGRALLARMLGLRVAAPDNGPSVVVLIPSLNNIKRNVEKAIEVMLHHTRQSGVLVHNVVVYGHSLVQWVRNEMVAQLYQANSGRWTHVLFIDDDIEPEADSLVKLLSHGKDIVGALCTVRTDPPIITLRDFDESTGDFKTRMHWKKDELLQVDGLGTGMMLISRDALDKITEFYLSCGYEKMLFGDTEQVTALSAKRRAEFTDKRDERWWLNGCWFQCLPAMNGRGEYGEDIGFCLKAKHCGIPVYCDTSVQPKHHGDYGYGVRDFLFYKQELLERDAAAKAPAQNAGGANEG